MRVSLAGVMLLAGCSVSHVGPAFDIPIPAGEVRDSLELKLTLEPRQDCEESFDLALYQHRGIELIRWDRPQGPGRCEGRRATIRYIPARIQRAQVIRLCRTAARQVEQVEQVRQP